jgi:hypothetical protein
MPRGTEGGKSLMPIPSLRRCGNVSLPMDKGGRTASVITATLKGIAEKENVGMRGKRTFSNNLTFDPHIPY